MKEQPVTMPTPGGKKPIVVVPRGTAKASLDELRRAGYLPVISTRPDAVKLLSAESVLPSGDVVKSALKALSESSANYERQVFVCELYRRLMDREKQQKGGQAV